MLVDDNMSPLLCYDHCKLFDASHMATQYSKERSCANENFLHDRHGDGECDMPCSGDPDEICGGSYSFDLYEMEWATPPSSDEFLGCFSDMKDDRVVGYFVDIKDMTVELREHCMDRGVEYMQLSTNMNAGADCRTNCRTTTDTGEESFT